EEARVDVRRGAAVEPHELLVRYAAGVLRLAGARRRAAYHESDRQSPPRDLDRAQNGLRVVARIGGAEVEDVWLPARPRPGRELGIESRVDHPDAKPAQLLLQLARCRAPAGHHRRPPPQRPPPQRPPDAVAAALVRPPS